VHDRKSPTGIGEELKPFTRDFAHFPKRLSVIANAVWCEYLETLT